MAAAKSKKMLTKPELSSFCAQIAMILHAGISTAEGLQIMLDDATDASEQQILRDLQDDFEDTGNLHEALSAVGIFPDYMIHMTGIGEESGTLDEVMDALSDHYAREDTLFKNIRNAITYPLIMIGVMIAVVVVLLVEIMPVFNQVFIQLGTEMTGFSAALMNIGIVLSRYAVVFIVIAACIVAFILYGALSKSGNALFRKIGYSLRSTRQVFESTAACRFASAMALTLRSGLNPIRSMELACAMNEDPVYQKKLDQCLEEMNHGGDFAETIRTSGVFKGIYARMASVGAKTGALDQTMAQIANLYQEEADRRIGQTISVLEPTLVVILSLIVGAILLSVILPLTGIISGI